MLREKSQSQTDKYLGFHFHEVLKQSDSEANKTKKIAFLRFTCQDGARHSYWIVKNLFCFSVKGRSFQGVNVSEL